MRLYRRLSKAANWLLTVLQVLYLIRYSLISLLIIALLMPVTLGPASTLLANLYDLDSGLKVFWFSLSAFLLTFSTITTLKLTLLYGGERIDFDREKRKSLDEKTRSIAGSRSFFLGACLLTLLMIFGVFFLNRDFQWYAAAGIAAGFAASIILLVAADTLQRLLNRKSKAESLGGFLMPVRSPLERIANESVRLHDLSNKVFRPRWLDATFKRVPSFLGRGYIKYEDGGLKPEIDGQGRAFVYPEHFTALALFFIFLVVYAVVGWTPKGFRDSLEVTALSYLMLLLTVLVWLMGALSFFLDRYRFPVVLFLIPIYLIASITSEDYLFPVLEQRPDEMQRLMSEPLTPAKVLQARQGGNYAIVVAANGGGIQAAAWTARVLTGIEEKCRHEFGPEFKGCAAKIRLISSVSGGSVGAMYFIDAFQDDKGISEDRLRAVRENAERTSLDAVAWGLVYPDFTRSFFPFPSGFGRGHALEDRWAEGNPNLGKGLMEWRDGVRRGWRPASIFNATIVETGERLLLSTSDICEKETVFGSCVERSGTEVLDPGNAAVKIDKKSFYSFLRGKDIPIKTAARLSASFPYVTPAPRPELGNEADGERPNYHHVADGGYYDNYGISSLIEWLNEGLSDKNIKPPDHILILQIRGDEVSPPIPSDQASTRPYFQTFVPLKTLLSVRTTGQLSHNEEQLEIFMRLWEKQGVKIETIVFEFPRESDAPSPPLSWHLREDEKRRLKDAWNQIDMENDDAKAWNAFREFIRSRVNEAGNAATQP